MNGFINPYNFISFPEKKAKAYTDTDVHTGVIEYTITTKTPLFIPNTSSDTAFSASDQTEDHKSYDFFSYCTLDSAKRYEEIYHEPVIPGSEIRGVIRSVYEVLTDSCMGVLNREEYPIKRTAAQFKPALIHRKKNGTMELYDAFSFRLGQAAVGGKIPNGFENCKNGSPVYFSRPQKQNRGYGVVRDYSFQKQTGINVTGYLLKWGMGVKKARYHVFALKEVNQRNSIILSRDIIERKLYPLLESYLNQPALKAINQNAYEEYKSDLKSFLSGEAEEYFPVNYSKLQENNPNTIVYLSPAIFTKEVSSDNLGGYAGAFAPCETNHCPACNLFGYVGKDHTSAHASKIRFSDLKVDSGVTSENWKEYYAKKVVTLENLGEPKLGNIDFYLKKPENANFWTYDYVIRNGQLTIEKQQLRGRKFYWHHRNVNLERKVEPSKLNKTIRPVKEEVRFHGKLFYEAISEKQLKQLIWILNSGHENLGLKLGGAKPLGFGSVVCNVEKVLERKIVVSEDHKIVYRMDEISEDNVTYESCGFSRDVRDPFLKITGLYSVPKEIEITYPKTIEQKNQTMTEGYRWFMNNHGTVSGKRMAINRVDMKVEQSLPDIMDKDFSLKFNSHSQRDKLIGNGKRFSRNRGYTSHPYKNRKG